jgi:broad specificity phosphatase PhoE
MKTDSPLRVHLMRHGKVDSHRGDLPLTDDGLKQAEAVGRRFSGELVSGEIATLLYAPTRRARETAEIIDRTLAKVYGRVDHQAFQLLAPAENWALRNPDLYVAGRRVEMVSSAEAMAEQLLSSGPGPEELMKLPFLRSFWEDLDRIGYWVNHPNPPGEDADTVARRVLTFAGSLLDLPREHPSRYFCITHSPVMRSFLRRYLLGYDPGEPDYVESVDMTFDPERSVTIRYREYSRSLAF